MSPTISAGTFDTTHIIGAFHWESPLPCMCTRMTSQHLDAMEADLAAIKLARVTWVLYFNPIFQAWFPHLLHQWSLEVCLHSRWWDARVLLFPTRGDRSTKPLATLLCTQSTSIFLPSQATTLSSGWPRLTPNSLFRKPHQKCASPLLRSAWRGWHGIGSRSSPTLIQTSIRTPSSMLS